MSWPWFFTFCVLLWAVSYWKILNSPLPGENMKKKKKVLLVIAHPDDETMFFSPTIRLLISQGHSLHILCMSTGNVEGKGNLRKEELYQASAALGIISRRVEVIDRPEIQDGFNERWDHDLLASIMGERIRVLGIDTIISFDDFGISGHPNHRDVSRGLRKFLEESANLVEAWELVSKGILRKYIGPVDFWFSLFCSLLCRPGETLFFVPNASPRLTYHAMAQHKTQWLWFRKLFVWLSSFTYTNTLRKVERPSPRGH